MQTSSTTVHTTSEAKDEAIVLVGHPNSDSLTTPMKFIIIQLGLL